MRHRIWQTPYRNTVATHFTPVCTVFPFPAQVLFHRYMFNANLSNSILSGITFTAPLPPLAKSLPQYGCNALYACLYSFSIFCASIISSPTSLRTSSLHANSVYGGNILAVTAIPNALWRSALVAHTTAVCTVFPFPAQVLFHPPQVRGRIFQLYIYLQDLQLFWCNFPFR